MELTPGHAVAFVYGVVGSLAVELVLAIQFASRRAGAPKRYKSWFFWSVRSALAIASGVIATAYYLPQMPWLLYVHVGAATPVLITRASRGGEGGEEEGEAAK
jgi:hypothetical protein